MTRARRAIGEAARGWRTILGYGAALALGALALQWLDWLWLARMQPTQVYVGLVATLFLALGAFVGVRLAAPRRVPLPAGNPDAQKALGISARELEVLRLLAGGGSNKEIARALGVSPNTVKTHAARLYEKLAVQRRTQAIARARELGLLP